MKKSALKGMLSYYSEEGLSDKKINSRMSPKTSEFLLQSLKETPNPSE